MPSADRELLIHGGELRLAAIILPESPANGCFVAKAQRLQVRWFSPAEVAEEDWKIAVAEQVELGKVVVLKDHRNRRFTPIEE